MNKYLLLAMLFVIPKVTMALNTSVLSNEDVIGCWERIDFSKAAQKRMNMIEPWPIRYQWFCFEPDGTLYTHSASVYSEHTEESLREVFKSIPKDITYTIPHKGIIVTEQQSANQKIVWGANFMGKSAEFDGKTLEKGTFFMSIFNQKLKQNVYYRYLRKLK